MATNDTSIELYENAIPFSTIYTNFNISTLPRWVQDNINEARVYGEQNRCVIIPDGRKYHLDNKLNDLCGRDWTLFINSVFSTSFPTSGKESYAHQIRRVHPTPKPPQLMRDLICFFTKEGETVLDTFMGVGGTLLGASLCNRKAIGIDINKEYISSYNRASESLGYKPQNTFCGDCIHILKNTKLIDSVLKDDSVSLLLIDPPYSNMMSKKKTGGDISVYGKTATPFSNKKEDLGNMKKEEFLFSLKESVELALPYIKKRGYIVVFIKDLQPNKKEVNFLHCDIINKLNEIDRIYYKGMKIWVDETTKPYPYGYPFCFVANQTHQYILIFRKEK